LNLSDAKYDRQTIKSNELKQNIQNAIKLLRENGYEIIKITKEMHKDMDECVEADESRHPKDCCGCSCSICLMQQ